MIITVPEFSLILLVGPAGSGKSAFARRHFAEAEICHSPQADDPMGSTGEAQGVAMPDSLLQVVGARLERRLLTVVDLPNLQPRARRALLALARDHDAAAVAIVFALPVGVCLQVARNHGVPARVVRHQCELLRHALPRLVTEGFRQVSVFESPDSVAEAEIERQPLVVNATQRKGPFDIIGDVHGCLPELLELLAELGFEVRASQDSDDVASLVHPAGRTPVFLGDLVDRGPESMRVLRLVMQLVNTGTALAVQGNHDRKLASLLRKSVSVRPEEAYFDTIGTLLASTAGQFVEDVPGFLEALPSHLVLDAGNLVVAHAGLPESLQGRDSRRVTEFALYGDVTGETDEFGLPVRRDWAAAYRGLACVVYGHTPVANPVWVNNTINIDTGCVFGGRLTALRWPERELVSVPARAAYAHWPRPVT